MRKKIILVSGDPNSINSEIIFKCWKILPKKIKKKLFLISNFDLLNEQFKKLKYKVHLVKVENLNENYDLNKLKILNINLKFKDPFKVSSLSASKYILKSLDLAHNLALNKNVAGVINCPIDKKYLKRKNIGVTEFLASKCNLDKNSVVMLIKNEKLTVCPITTHLDIKSVSGNLNIKNIVKKIKIINTWYKKFYKMKPKIAVMGLNPHNAELRKDSEEKKIIIPAINKINRMGISIKGPLVSDTLFIDQYKNYDVIVGMYHDQVITPFKTLFKFNAINLTLGLKYLRVSPDHGVAIDKILRKISDPQSLLKCINYIYKISK